MRQLSVAIAIVGVLWAGEADAASHPQQAKTAQKKARVLEKKAAGEESKAPSSSPAKIRKAEVQAVDPAGTGVVNNAVTCLSRTIYWEARGDGAAGMEAIASVVMNRLGHEGFPNTVCTIVKEGSRDGFCQFTWWCDRRTDEAKDGQSYALAKEISRRALNRQLRDRTGGALYFHQQKVTPTWSKRYLRTAHVGHLLFYKPRGHTAK